MQISNLHDYISKNMIGRIGMLASECDLLGETVKDSQRHLEIGTLWGGTAILSALAGAKRVYTIDKLSGGWWEDRRDPQVDHPLEPAAIVENLARLQVRDRVSLVIAPSDPFPLDGLTFDTVLIDGDHTYAGVQADWENVHNITSDYVLFHNCDDLHPGVNEFIKSGTIEAHGWRLIEQIHSLRVYAKK